MSLDVRLWNIVHLKPSKTESIILSTLAKINYGNTYQIWKNSGLKNYPTVLRAIKKLQKRKFVGKTEKSGSRGETVYSSTLQGALVYYVFNNKEERVILLAQKESTLFNELGRLPIARDIALDAASKFISDSQKKDQISFKDEIENAIKETIGDYVFDLVFNAKKEHENLLINISRHEELKKIVTDKIKEERDILANMNSSLDQLENQLQKLLKIKEC